MAKQHKAFLSVSRNGNMKLTKTQPAGSRGECVFPIVVTMPDPVDMPPVRITMPAQSEAEVTLDALDVIAGDIDMFPEGGGVGGRMD